MKKEIIKLMDIIWKDFNFLLIAVGIILILIVIIPMWVIGIILIATGCLGVTLKEFNKAM